MRVQTHVRSADSWIPEQEGLRILLAYDDAESALRGIHLCEQLTAEMKLDAEPRLFVWKTGVFNNSDARLAATRDAQKADVLIVALAHSAPLPRGVVSWLNDCAGRRGARPGSLVLLLNPAAMVEGSVPKFRHWIQSLAESAEMHFLCPVAPAAHVARTLADDYCRENGVRRRDGPQEWSVSAERSDRVPAMPSTGGA